VIVDTSIIVALSLNEPTVEWIRSALDEADNEALRMSWVNVAEVSMILGRPHPLSVDALEPLLDGLGVEILQADHDVVRMATTARFRFPLNFGDCFAYAHAKLRDEALLTLDDDFLKTDLERLLHPRRRR